MTGEILAAELARLRARIDQLERRATRTATITASDPSSDTCTIEVPDDDSGTVQLSGIPLGRSYATVGATVQLVQTGHTPVAVPPADRIVAGSITAIERGGDGAQLVPDIAAQDADLRARRLASLDTDAADPDLIPTAEWDGTTRHGRAGWHLSIAPDGGDDTSIVYTVDTSTGTDSGWVECPPSRIVTVRGLLSRDGPGLVGTLRYEIEYATSPAAADIVTNEIGSITASEITTSSWTPISRTLGPPLDVDPDEPISHCRIRVVAANGATSSSTARWRIADLSATAGMGETGVDRSTLTPDGLRVYESGVEVIALVSGQAQRIRITDPTTLQTLASVSDVGRIYGQVLDAPSIIYIGRELADIIQDGPRGIIAYDTTTANSSSYSSETVIQTITGLLEENRLYRIKTNPFRAQRSTAGDGAFRLRVEVNGTVTTSSTRIAQTALAVRSDSARTPVVLESDPIAFDFGGADAGDVQVGLTIEALSSGTIQTVAASAYPLSVYIEDLGRYIAPGDNAGETVVAADWSGSFDTGDGISPLDSRPWAYTATTDDDMWVGRRHNGPTDADNYVGAFGFPASVITDFAAATTIEYIDIVVTVDALGTKTTQSLDIGHHGYTSRPTSIQTGDTITLADQTETGIPHPGQWTYRLPSAWHAGIAAGTIRGVVFGPNQDGDDTDEDPSYNGVIGGEARDDSAILIRYRVR